MMAPQAAKPIAATRFANLMCWIGSVQSGALLRRSNDSLVYPRNKNGTPWLPWRTPGDKRSALQLLDCPKAKQSSAIALTKSARWNQLSALKREQLYRRSSKIQFALWWLSGVSACRRVVRSRLDEDRQSPWDIPPRFNDPSVGLVDHFDDLPDDFVTSVIESRERLRRDISVTKCNLQVYLCFRRLLSPRH
jgi:hypothetical protein